MIQASKVKLAKVSNAFSRAGQWVASKYRNNRKKCRGTFITLATLFLLAGLITGSYKSVDSLSRGAPINFTSGQLQDKTVANQGGFMGLNTYYQTIPATNFMISFQVKRENPEHSFKAIRARVKQGTLIEIQTYAKVLITASNLQTFFSNYGFSDIEGHPSWLIYLKEKIRNVVAQQVGKYRFYQISNKALAQSINQQFISYETQTSLYFPFVVRMASINIRYPQGEKLSKQTLGVKLLEKQSLLNQLKTHLTQLQSYISLYSPQAVTYSQIRGQIEGQIAGRQRSLKLSSQNWAQGVNLFSQRVQSNSTLVQKYLQLYFKSLYDTTFRVQSLQPFQI